MLKSPKGVFMLKNKEHYEKINEFYISVEYSETDSHSPQNTFDSHVHEECEIYVNLSGDVSFVVENRIYPISYGSIVISRPFEYHHCVYHSNKRHKHYWILFSSNGNEGLLDVFFKRQLGEKNLLSLPPEETEELLILLKEMREKNSSKAEKYYKFFKLITLLNSAESLNPTKSCYPDDITFALNYISHNLCSYISISKMAKEANVSVNTLERHFMQVLNTTPTDYIKKKRLAYAAKLLSEGYTVAEASEYSGFSDYSGFIALFKKIYKITPLKYKKALSRNPL